MHKTGANKVVWEHMENTWFQNGWICEDWGEEFEVSLEKLIGKKWGWQGEGTQIKMNIFYQSIMFFASLKDINGRKSYGDKWHTLCWSQRTNLWKNNTRKWTYESWLVTMRRFHLREDTSSILELTVGLMNKKKKKSGNRVTLQRKWRNMRLIIRQGRPQTLT